MKITRRERKIILKHLKDLNKEYPDKRKGYNGVTMIRYGYMNCNFIFANKIEQVAKEIGVKYW